MLPVTELMNISFVKSAQSSATTEHALLLRTIERNVAYGSHTELARFNLLICMSDRMPDFRPRDTGL